MTYPGVILKAYNLYAKKQLGQNFLTDPSVPQMIVRRSGISPEDTVIEVGPGLGAMTVPLAQTAKKVYAIEKDRELVPLLKAEMLSTLPDQKNIEIINANFLKTDIKEFIDDPTEKLVVVGNLPYNISSQILMYLIPVRQMIKKAVFMFQKELAERIIASPGGKDYGRLSVAMQYCASTKKIADIKSNQFFPKPKVDSVVVDIAFHDPPPIKVNNEKFFYSVIKAAFGKRRKTLKNALSNSNLGIQGEALIQALESASIDPVRRAETLSVEEFVKLTDKLEALT